MTRYAPLWQQANDYTASQDRSLLSALWPAGGVSGGAVTAVNNQMKVNVAAGVAAVPLASGQGVALCRWDASEVPAPDHSPAPGSGTSRVDLVVVQVRDNALDSGADNDFILTTVKGTAAALATTKDGPMSTAVAPATPANALALATVTVPGAAANLNTATIAPVTAGLSAMTENPAGRMTPTANSPIGSSLSYVSSMAADFARGGMIYDNANALVIPVRGIYTVSIQILFSSTQFGVVGNGTYNVILIKNGQTIRQASGAIAASGVVPSFGLTDQVNLNPGDRLLLAGTTNVSTVVATAPSTGTSLSAALSSRY